MRERLLLSFGTLMLVIIALYGIPRAYLLAEGVQEWETVQVEDAAELFEALIPERAQNAEVTEAYLSDLLREAERIDYLDADGETIASAGADLPEREDDIVVVRDLPQGQQLILSRSGTYVQGQIVDAVLPVAVIGVTLVTGAGVVCLLLARRLSRPFRELARTARQLGEGRFDIPEHQYRLPEAQQIGTALSESARQLQDMLDREREFAANASHQLRTPITALRLELEDLTYWPETSPEVAAELHNALGELDRLSTAVTELLDLARGQRLGAPVTVRLADLLQDCAHRWLRRAEMDGRALLVHAPAELTGVLHHGVVDQIFDVLIENAFSHGSGDVVLRAEDAGTHLRLSVADQGATPDRAGVFERGISHGGGEGIGLAVAAELATAAGATLRLESGSTTCFMLRIPLARSPMPVMTGISSGTE